MSPIRFFVRTTDQTESKTDCEQQNQDIVKTEHFEGK
jgi:hypothetical protein